MEIYMDNSATTLPYDEVCDTVFDAMKRFYANPLVGDLTGQAGAGLCVLCALVVVSALAAAHKTRYNGRGA